MTDKECEELQNELREIGQDILDAARDLNLVQPRDKGFELDVLIKMLEPIAVKLKSTSENLIT